MLLSTIWHILSLWTFAALREITAKMAVHTYKNEIYARDLQCLFGKNEFDILMHEHMTCGQSQLFTLSCKRNVLASGTIWA